MNNKSALKKCFITSAVTFVLTVILIAVLLFVWPFNLGTTFFKLLQIDFLVRNNYFGEVDGVDFDTALCAGYLSQLEDDYADYYSIEESLDKFQSFEGDRVGIGVTFIAHPDTYYYHIVTVSDESPAQKSGLMENDQIVSINGESVTKDNYGTLYQQLTGEVGQSVDITVLRGDEQIDMEITFDNYVLQTVYYERIENVGYIKITSFNFQTDKQLINAVDSLVADGVESLIFDLRDNLGGTADSVASAVDYLVPKGDILSVNYINGKSEVLYKSDVAEVNLPMAVLVNNNTASAAEIFAASIRDFNKGVLIGDTTYGKGIMQKTYMLIDKSAVRFTVAEYVTNSGISYNKVGIEPDYFVKLNSYQEKYYFILSNDENPYIQKALEVLNEK